MQGLPPGVSRRTLLFGATLLPFVPMQRAVAQNLDSILACVGCYTPDGEGIYTVRVDLTTGALTEAAVTHTPNPSWLALSPNKHTLYAVNELDTYEGAAGGSVSAFAVNRETGQLTALNTVASGGATPPYVSVHPSGRFLLVANYGGGSVAVFSLQPDGSIGTRVDFQHGQGSPHPPPAADNLPGNFAPSDHAASHMHMIAADPSGRFVIADDAGFDQIRVWAIDTSSGKLTPAATVDVTPGAAPRHSISILPAGFAGSNLASELAISRDGQFLYAANRLHNTIAQIRISADGTLAQVDETWVHGDYPRSFALAPSGRVLLCTNQRSDSITSFRIDPESGRLSFTGQFFPIGSPVNLTFLA